MTERNKLKDNLMFVGTIYDSFEALEETMGKLKLERPLFITHVAKMAFAEEVFKCTHPTTVKKFQMPPKTVVKPTVTRLYN